MGESGDNAEQLPASQPPLCSNGCGFFGNPATRGLCSKCYKQQLALEESERKAAHPSASVEAAQTGGSEQQEEHESLQNQAKSVQDVKHPPAYLSQAQQQQQHVPAEVVTQAQHVDNSNGAAAAAAAAAAAVSASAEADANAGEDEQQRQEQVQKDRTRCFVCNKKVGLTGFECRCKYVFCGSHRYADKHNCQIDYKSIGREEVAKHNPAVVADKVSKI